MGTHGYIILKSCQKRLNIRPIDHFSTTFDTSKAKEIFIVVLQRNILREYRPSEWGISGIVPMFKKEDLTLPENYRGIIALTPNEHRDYPRRAPFTRPPLVWSSWLLDNYTNMLSGNWIYTGSPILMYFPCHVVATSTVGHYVIHIITTDSKIIMDYSSKRRCMSIHVD